MVIKGPQSKSTKYTHPTFAKTKGNKNRYIWKKWALLIQVEQKEKEEKFKYKSR